MAFEPNRRTVLGAMAGFSGVALLSGCGSSSAAIRPAGPQRDGGTLRVGVTGGGSADTIDPHTPSTNPDIARVINLYEPLLYRDQDYVLRPALALSVTPSADARTWTAKLRPGVRFHDGREVSADDVVATFRRILDPNDPKTLATSLGMVRDVVAVGDRQVQFRLSEPSPEFDDYLGQYAAGIVPANFDLKKPIGTGPFKMHTFTAGQQSSFVRNEFYWRPGEPHVDRLDLINFADDDARVNALLSAQVDAIDQVPLALVRVLDSYPAIRVLASQTGTWLPFTIRVDVEPFDDPQVRQALRLIADRPQLINQVLSGHGRPANDLYAPYDPAYLRSAPQRAQSIERAKGLLQRAGKSRLQLELTTSPIQAGIVESAEVFATQARAANVDIKINKVDTSTFFSDKYTNWPFAQSFWYTRNYLPQAASCAMPGAPYNETHWHDKDYVALIKKARVELDQRKRSALLADAQRIEYANGGYLIWSFADVTDATQSYVGGLVPNKTGISLSGYEFRKAWVGA